MKKLLLTSAGFENPKIGEEFLKSVNKPVSEIKIIFVPTALCRLPVAGAEVMVWMTF